MKKTQMTGLLVAAILMAGAVQATLLVRDEFNTAAAADPDNGIYQTGTSFGDPVNTNVVGGTIAGFDGTTGWTTSGTFIGPYAQVMRLKKRTYGGTYAGRKISPAISGRSQAYAKATMRILSGTGGSAAAGASWAFAGFSATYSLGSAGGAVVGYYWDGSEWDLALRYNKNGTVGVATIMDGASYDTTYAIYWAMDETLNTIKVWVDNNDPAATPDLAVTDWTGTVKDIAYLSAGHSETGDSDVYVYDLQLGDAAGDVGMLPAPLPAGLLVRDDFNTSSTAYSGYANGIYKTGTDIGASGNATTTGGSIVGFDATTAWNASGFFDAYANLLRLYHRTYSATYGARAITNSMAGKTKAYARTEMNIRSGSGGSATAAYAYIGFASNDALGSEGGAAVGYKWDAANAQWDLALRYRDGSGTAVTATIMTNVAYGMHYEIYWGMDADTDTIKVWVNEDDVSATPTLTVTDWTGTVKDIAYLSAGHAETGTSDVWVYDIMLGETPESIGMEVPSTTATAEILSIEPFSDTVMKLVVSADHPELCYPKSRSSLLMGTWNGVGHSTNGVAPFTVTNLTYSAAAGSDYVIYIEADSNEQFIKIGAQ